MMFTTVLADPPWPPWQGRGQGVTRSKVKRGTRDVPYQTMSIEEVCRMSNIYTTVLADPGWRYDDNLTMSDVKRGATSRYTTMSTDAICALAERHAASLTIAGHAIADDVFLWLWVTNPFILNGDGVRVCRAWGFEPKQLVPWVKGRIDCDAEVMNDDAECTCGGQDDGLHGKSCATRTLIRRPRLVCRTGLGHYTRGVTEHLILATRGRPKRLVRSHGEDGLIVAPEEAFILEPPTAHSRKPEAQYAKIERVCPGPYLELFATRRRDGWTSWGDQLPSLFEH